MAEELLALSNFKLQLLALVYEARDLRERERSAGEELQHSNQRQKQIEADCSKQLQELRAELASRDDAQKKLESRVKCLENENVLLQKKEKDLKDTINGLLEARETFLRNYEDSTCTLQRTIQVKDRKLAVISEKLHAYLDLLSSVEKEAAAIRKVLHGVENLVNEKEQVAARLKDKVHKILTLEKDFIEKISFLESKLTDRRLELRQRDTMISELKESLESEKSRRNFEPQIEEISIPSDYFCVHEDRLKLNVA